MKIRHIYLILFSIIVLFFGLTAKVSADTEELKWEEDYFTIYTMENEGDIATIRLINSYQALIKLNVNGETAEGVAEYTIVDYDERVIKLIVDTNVYGVVLKEDKTFEEYDQVLELEYEQQVEKSKNEITDTISKVITWVVSILSSLGISWGCIATIIGWINKKLSSYVADLKQVYEVIATQNIEFENLRKENKELKNEISELKDLIKIAYDQDQEKKVSINNVIAGVLTDGSQEEESTKE